MPKKQVFPQRLKQLRTDRELSQEALAKKTGLQPTAISHFENGSRKPSFENLRTIADAFEVSVDYLMGRTDSPDAVLAEGDQMFRDYEKLTEDEREIARDFMATLARRHDKSGDRRG
jgi:transcriptional regulator with XRE-family HTH domain